MRNKGNYSIYLDLCCTNPILGTHIPEDIFHINDAPFHPLHEMRHIMSRETGFKNHCLKYTLMVHYTFPYEKYILGM